MNQIDKKSLKHLAELARLELTEKESEKFLEDLEEILNHFRELQELNTDNVLPMNGGTGLQNVFREDRPGAPFDTGKIREAFPEKENGFLKIPPVFE